MDLETVIYEVKDNIARITMNRPDKKNALNHALWDDLIAAFDYADNDPEARVVILCGAGTAFCSGWDLKEGYYVSTPAGYDHWTTGNALKTLRYISQGYLKIMDLTKPVIAQVHGYCLAAGCYLEMLCDVAVAAEDAVLGHPATQSGGVDSMPLWVTYLGLRKTKELFMTRRFIDGKEAERIGLVNRAVPADKLEEEVWEMAKLMAEVPPDGMAIMKEAFNTHAEIMGRGAVFTYHQQLNALGRVGRAGTVHDLDKLRGQSRGKQVQS